MNKIKKLEVAEMLKNSLVKSKKGNVYILTLDIEKLLDVFTQKSAPSTTSKIYDVFVCCMKDTLYKLCMILTIFLCVLLLIISSV